MIEQPGLWVAIHAIEVAGARTQAKAVRSNNSCFLHADPDCDIH
jgi:hypothetical protein